VANTISNINLTSELQLVDNHAAVEMALPLASEARAVRATREVSSMKAMKAMKAMGS
jgi:hypothetical protein